MNVKCNVTIVHKRTGEVFKVVAEATNAVTGERFVVYESNKSKVFCEPFSTFINGKFKEC